MFTSESIRFGLLSLFLSGLAVFPIWHGSAEELIGAGPDVVSTLWGMWWFQHDDAAIFSSTHTTLANHPNGVVGVVLAPSAAFSWALIEPILGTGPALRLAASVQILGLLSGVVAISLQLTQSKWAALFGGLSLCTGRYLYYSIGEASLVAIAAIPMVWGLFLCLRMERRARVLTAIGVVLCAVWTALENPYLAPILPVVLFVVSVQKWVQSQKSLAAWMFFTAIFGFFGLVWVASLFKGAANPDYPREVAGQVVSILGRRWEIIDLPWARLTWWTVAWPEMLNWTVGVDDARQATGGRYLGLSVVVIGLYGLVHARRWRWLILGGLCFALALGSVSFGLSGLFLFVNGLMDAIARPLTQPTRFVLVLQVVLALGVSSAAQAVIQKKNSYGLVMASLLLCDAFFVGGLGLQIPTTPLPQVKCDIEGPVLLWPHDARDGAQSQSQLYQISHEQPAPHTAIASWATSGERTLDSLRAAGYRLDSRQVKLTRLKQLGYQSIIVEGEAPVWVDEAHLVACGSLQVLDLGD